VPPTRYAEFNAISGPFFLENSGLRKAEKLIQDPILAGLQQFFPRVKDVSSEL
jgi:hypothetical protein